MTPLDAQNTRSSIEEKQSYVSETWHRVEHVYKLSRSLILQKVFHRAPWKAFLGTKAVFTSWTTKIIFHISLLILTTTFVLLDNYQWGSYNRASAAVSCRYFLPNDRVCSFDTCMTSLTTSYPTLEPYSCSVFTRQDAIASILASIYSYQTINSTAIGQYIHPQALIQQLDEASDLHCTPNNDFPQPSITLSYRDQPTEVVLLPVSSLNSQEANQALLEEELNANNFAHITAIELKFPLFNSFFTDIYHANYLWDFTILYDKSSSKMVFEVSSTQRISHICSIKSSDSYAHIALQPALAAGGIVNYEGALHIVSIMIIVIALFYLLLLCFDLVDNLRLVFYVHDLFTLASQHNNLETAQPPATNDNQSSYNTIYNRIFATIRWLIGVPYFDDKQMHSLTTRLLADIEDQEPTPVVTAPAALYGTPPSLHSNNNCKDKRVLYHWQQLSLRVKMRLLDGWRWLAALGALLALYSAIIFSQVNVGYYATYASALVADDSPRLILGFATAIQYLTLLAYLRYSNRFTASTLVLWGAFFKVQRVFVGMLPVMVGFICLGIVTFGFYSDSFGDFLTMFITLFSVMNCDSIWQTYQDANAAPVIAFAGTLYVTIIFVLFNYLLLRLILAVVESLYFYLRLYTNAQRKRIIFRKRILQQVGVTAKRDKDVMRVHSAEEIQLSLVRIYSQQMTGRPHPVMNPISSDVNSS